MISINHQQILNRYDTLPESLKDAGFLPYNTLLIKKIGESNHLTGEKISTISQLVGYVLFGFIHTEDLAKEIKTELNIAPEIANSVAQEIDRKIFTPIRADLEKVYQPPTEEALDLRAKVEPPTEVEMPKAEPIAVEISKAEEQKIVPVEEKKEIQYQEVQPPKINGQYGEEEGPVIIHKEVEFKPLSGTKKSLGGLFGFLRKDKEEKISPVKAEVEIGELKEESEKREAKSEEQKEPPKVRVVHYTEFPTPVSPFGKTEEEVTAEAEKPAVAEAMAGKNEIKPPENLPIKTEPETGLVKETKKEEVQQVEEKIQPLDLRKTPAVAEAMAGKPAADSAFVATLASPEPSAKRGSAKEAAALSGKPEENKPTKPPMVSKAEPEEEEIIDLSSFK